MIEHIASVVNGVTDYIDVRPPFVAGDEFFDECSDAFGVDLKHFATTANTTRLEVTDKTGTTSREVNEA